LYSNNAKNIHHLTTHSMTFCPTTWRSHCDHRYVTSLHPMYRLSSGVGLHISFECVKLVFEFCTQQVSVSYPLDNKHPKDGVVRVMWPIFKFGGPALSLEWGKLGISVLLCRVTLASTSLCMIVYPKWRCVQGHVTSLIFDK